MKRLVLGAAGLAALTAFVRPQAVTRVFDRTTLDSVYTTAQAAHGDTIYRRNCAKCHGSVSNGVPSSAPSTEDGPLFGKDFLGNWSGQTLDQLYDKINTTMPSDNPKTLPAKDVVDVMAFILSMNEMPAGAARLPEISDSLKTIKLVRSR